MPSYTIDSKGRFRSSDDLLTPRSCIEFLINNKRFGNAVSIANELFPDSNYVIAGGFLRDLVLDRPIKDLDIFVTDKKHFYLPTQNDEYNSTDKTIIATRYIKHDGETVNISLVETLKDLTERFPINLSMISYKSYGKFNITDKFLNDANQKKITINHRFNNEDYVKRIKEKYPDFKFNPMLGDTLW